MDNPLQDFEAELAKGKRAVDLAFVAGSSAALVGGAFVLCTLWIVW
jgi:hypothetical protein